jgi:DNA-binding transcriptional regulator YiaG
MNNSKKPKEGEAMMPVLSFGYKCQECGQGTVREQIFHGYKTKLKGLPLTVDDARIGVCDLCGARHFDSRETMRWRTLINDKYAEAYLQPSDIQDLIKQLSLSMEQFANLVGCTRQSLYNWQRPDRTAPQSRMADLFMRLIRESHSAGQVNVLRFLCNEASKLGFDLDVSNSNANTPIITFPQKLRLAGAGVAIGSSLKLAAATDSAEESVVLVTEEGEKIARAFHGFQDGMLKFDFVSSVPFSEFDAEIWFEDGTSATARGLQIKASEALSVCRTPHTEDEIKRVVFTPKAKE